MREKNPIIVEEKEPRYSKNINKEKKGAKFKILILVTVLVGVIVLLGVGFGIGFFMPTHTQNFVSGFVKSSSVKSKESEAKSSEKTVVSSEPNDLELLKEWKNIYSAGNTTWSSNITINLDGTFKMQKTAGVDNQLISSGKETPENAGTIMKGTVEISSKPFEGVTYNYGIPNNGANKRTTALTSVKPVIYFKFKNSTISQNDGTRIVTKENNDISYFFGIDGDYSYSYSIASGITRGKALVSNEPSVNKEIMNMVYTLPLKSSTQASNQTYIVAQGDTLASIAGKFGITVEQLDMWNGIGTDGLYQNSGKGVFPGDVLKVEAPAPSAMPNTINVEQIKQGDYSSIQGVYKSQYDEYIISKNSITMKWQGHSTTYVYGQPVGSTNSPFYIPAFGRSISNQNGILWWTIEDAYIAFGVKGTNIGNGILSDDAIWSGQNTPSIKNVAYKVR